MKPSRSLLPMPPNRFIFTPPNRFTPLILLLVPLIWLALAAGPSASARPDDEANPPRHQQTAPTDGVASPADGPQAEAPINGPAWWGTAPTGPDFAGIRRTRFQPRNPSAAALAATRAQRVAYLDQAEVPENIQVSAEGQTAGASRLVTDFSEVMVAVDPVDPLHLLGSSKFFHTPAAYGFFTGVFESFDGGETWEQEQPAGIERYSLTSDPVNTFDNAGNGYFTLLTRAPVGLDMLKKPRGGAWGPPVVVDRTTTTDKQWIIADQDWLEQSPHAGNVYMSWTDVGSGQIVFARSTNGNQSWSAPPVVLAAGELQGSIPGVGPSGTVYVIYGRNIFGGGDGAIDWVKSTDGGLTFTLPATAAQLRSIPFQLPNSSFRTPASLPAFAVSPTDEYLYVAWSDNRNGDADIYLARSLDGGATWSEPARLNDDPLSNGVDQIQPQVAVAPNGRVSVMWFDRRLPCPDLTWIPRDHVGRENFCIDTFMTRSHDDGATWEPNLRASAQSWDWSLNLPMVDARTGFIGDYQGLAATRDFDYPFWNATANLGRNPQNRQQIFIAPMPAAPLPVDLAPSRLSVSPAVVRPGGGLTYTLTLENRGTEDAQAVRASAMLPLSTTYVADSLTASAGLATYDPLRRTIEWGGDVSAAGGSVVIAYRVTVDGGAGDGTGVQALAEITEAGGRHYRREAFATVSTPPTISSTRPGDGETAVGLGTVIIVNFSEAMDPRSLVYTVTPDPGEWQAVWARNGRSVSLRHTNPFTPDQRTTVHIDATDASGDPLAQGAVPNPWTFTTEAAPTGGAYLPWAGRGAVLR
jgi:uncharacterized repeat protein (TIGR01451 family)